MLYLDIETDGVDRLVCVGYAFDGGEVHTSPTLPQSVRDALADADETVVTHSGYDVRFLFQHEGAVINCQMYDTMVMAWLHNENTRLDLAWCVQRYLGITLDKTLQKYNPNTPYDDLAAYCAKDVDVTRQLSFILRKHLESDGLWEYFEVVEAPFTATLRQMEFRGLPVNIPQAGALETVYAQRVAKMEERLRVGLPEAFNPRSPEQVGKLLASSKFMVSGRIPHDELDGTLAALAGVETGEGFETDWESVEPGTFVTTKEGRKWDHGVWVVKGRGNGRFDEGLATVARPALLDDNTLSQDPWVQDYLQYKKYDKLVSTYLKVFREQERGGRVYGRFNQTGTATGRLSSSGPNLQNIPSRGVEGQEIRSLFQGNLVVGDFSQLEPRLMAHFSQDPYMLDAFRRGDDLYEEIARRVGVSRGVAKTLVLAMSYGAGAEKVAQTLRLNGHPSTTAEASKHLRRLQSEYRVYFTWRDGIIAASGRAGYVTTIDGRKRRLDGKDRAQWKDPSRGGRQAANAVVQGSAADIVRRVMLHADKMFPNLKLLAQVHDELVWEYDPTVYTPDLQALETWVLRIAERGLSVPLVFEPHMGTDWYRAKEGI